MATDREGFAKTHGLFFREGRVRVYILFGPDISQIEKERIIGTYRIHVEKESENLWRAAVPVEELISLAKEEIIRSIGLPDRPVAQ